MGETQGRAYSRSSFTTTRLTTQRRVEVAKTLMEMENSEFFLNVLVTKDDKCIFFGEPEQTEDVGDARSRC